MIRWDEEIRKKLSTFCHFLQKIRTFEIGHGKLVSVLTNNTAHLILTMLYTLQNSLNVGIVHR